MSTLERLRDVVLVLCCVSAPVLAIIGTMVHEGVL